MQKYLRSSSPETAWEKDALNQHTFVDFDGKKIVLFDVLAFYKKLKAE